MLVLILIPYLIAPTGISVDTEETIIDLWLEKIAWVESRNKSSAVSPMGAIGVHQIMPATQSKYNYLATMLT